MQNEPIRPAQSTQATRIYLCRHGGTTSSDQDLYAGAIDPELSDDGVRQVRALAARLTHVKFAAAYCSEKVRAARTAREICQSHGIEPVITTALREINHGHWEGKPRKLVREQFRPEYKRVSADPISLAPQGGETGASVLARAMPALATIAADHVGQSVLVVSHTGTNRLLLCALMGIDPRHYRDRIVQDLACLNILSYRAPGEAQVILLNDTSHYKPI